MRLFVALNDPVALERLQGLPVRREWQAVVLTGDDGDEVPGVMVDVDSWRLEVTAFDDYMIGLGYARVPTMVHVRKVWVAHAERYTPVP